MNSAEVNAPKHFSLTKRYADPFLKNCIGTISFASDKDEPALQAADLIAWHSRRHLAGIDHTDDVRSENYRLLRDSVASYSRGVAQEEGLRSFNDQVNKLIELIGTFQPEEEE
jgi:hypothetical protein